MLIKLIISPLYLFQLPME